MNLYQRIVLVIGAVALVVILVTCPTKGAFGLDGLDTTVFAVRAFTSIGVTALIYFVLSGIQRQKDN